MAAAVELIGKGWKFPIKVNAKGGLSYSAGPERIQDAIWIVLSTSLRERLMRPDFGAGVHDYVFQPNSDVMRTRLQSAVNDALLKWEPRIELTNVNVQEGDQPSQVLVSIDYRIRTTNELFNLVYPLYVQEGAG
jgi:phage baseplate assembly protein W